MNTIENSNIPAAEAATPVATPKRPRRGIGSARGTTRLKFDHKMALPNGLFLGHIDEVSVSMVTIGEDTSGMPSFNGLEVPRLNIIFASNEDDVNKRKYAPLSFLAQESNAETIYGGKNEWQINRIFDYLQHILKVFVLKGRELTEEEEIALSLDFEDTDEDGNYIPVPAEEVIASWTKVFNNFTTMLNTGRNGAPVFKSKDGKNIQVYGKLIRCVKTKKGWQNVTNGDLAFPTYVGEGVFEIVVQNQTPALRIDVVRESIAPRVLEAAKKPNMPNNPMGVTGGLPGGYAGVTVPMGGGLADPMAGPEGIAMEAAEDSPF